MAADLPEEVLQLVFGYLEDHFVQKTCTLVCHSWLTSVRNNGRWSDKAKLPICLDDDGLRDFLERWPNLKTLEVLENQNLKGMNMKDFPHLEKIVWPTSMEFPELPKWVNVKKVFVNPQFSITLPAQPPLDVVYGLKIRLKQYEPCERANMVNISSKLKNLHDLSIFIKIPKILMVRSENIKGYVGFLDGLAASKSVKHLDVLMEDSEYDVQDLVVRSLGRLGPHEIRKTNIKFISMSDRGGRVRVPVANYLSLHTFGGEKSPRRAFPFMNSVKSMKFNVSQSMFQILFRFDAADVEDFEDTFTNNKSFFLYKINPHLETLTVTDLILNHIDTGFLKMMQKIHPNLKRFCIEDTNLTVPKKKLFEFINELGSLMDLHSKNIRIKIDDKPDRRPKSELKQLFQQCFRLIQQKFPINTTEIYIDGTKKGLEIRKELGKPAVFSENKFQSVPFDARKDVDSEEFLAEDSDSDAELDDHILNGNRHADPNDPLVHYQMNLMNWADHLDNAHGGVPIIIPEHHNVPQEFMHDLQEIALAEQQNHQFMLQLMDQHNQQNEQNEMNE